MDPLTRAALVGLQNGGELPEAVGEAEALVAALHLAPAEALLLRAGARALERRAGRLSTKHALPEAFPTAPAESAPLVPERAIPVLREAFRVRGGLDVEAMQLVAARGRILPPLLIPSALASGADPALIHAVVGARGAWLLAQNHTWKARLALPDPASLAERVEIGTRAERVAALVRLRASEPDRARDLVQAALTTDAPDVRLALLDALGPIRPEDEPLFIAALADRAAGVRDRAAERLAALPGSALASRALAALAPFVQLREKTGLAGMASRLLGVVATLVVEPPEMFAPEWGKDALIEKPPKGVGARAWWLVQLVGRVPPALIFPGRTPQEALPMLDGSDWREPMVAGLIRGSLLAHDARWLAALFPFAPPMGDALRPDRATLIRALPPEEAEHRVARLLREPDGIALVGTLPTPWSVTFARAFVSTLRADPPRLRYMAELAARALPPATFAAVLDLRENPDFTPHKSWLDPMCVTVELRNRLHQELSG